jgi:hypothetical protein
MVGLPADAAIHRVEGHEWTSLHELLALGVERNDHWGLAQAYLHSDKKFHRSLPDKALEVPRPGEKQKRDERDRVVTDVAEIARFFS